MEYAIDGNRVAVCGDTSDLDAYMKILNSSATAEAVAADGVKRETVRRAPQSSSREGLATHRLGRKSSDACCRPRTHAGYALPMPVAARLRRRRGVERVCVRHPRTQPVDHVPMR